MQTRVQKWGNSLALRIPSSIAKEAGLNPNSLVELSLAEGKLIVQPLAEFRLSLDQLLSGVTAENLHGEVETGPAVGREAW